MQAIKLSSIGVPVTHFDSHLEIMKMEQQTILMVCWTGAFQWFNTFQARVSKDFLKHSQVDLFFLTLPRDCGYLIPIEGALGSVKGKLLWQLMQVVLLKMDNLICHLKKLLFIDYCYIHLKIHTEKASIDIQWKFLTVNLIFGHTCVRFVM